MNERVDDSSEAMGATVVTKLERQDSVISILSSGIDLCRICHCDATCGELISPCYCSGSMRWVHQLCLNHWIRASHNRSCELCRYPYCMMTKMKPPCYWESLPMTPSEKRRLFCSVTFHFIALGCVIWSLYVLIERTVEEFNQAELEWQFWTKIVVEVIGCLGAVVLIFVWGNSYVSVFNKWIAFNRTFIIVSSSPPPVKKLLPVKSSPQRQNQPSITAALCTPQSIETPLGRGMCRSGSHSVLGNSDPEEMSSPADGKPGPAPEATVVSIPVGDAGSETDLTEERSSSDKSKEAKALLLPPVNYSPPDDRLYN